MSCKSIRLYSFNTKHKRLNQTKPKTFGFLSILLVTSPAGQWGPDETKELIAICGELERNSSVAKRSKALWEAVSSRMADRGFNRSSEQCKCKWKNLLIRYKGKETSDPETGRKCPFFEELQAVLLKEKRTCRDYFLNPRRVLPVPRRSIGNLKKRKAERVILPRVSNTTASFNCGTSTIPEMLNEFLKQQQRTEIEWREMMERRAHERQLFEQEWRQKMVKVERELLMTEKAWREREEQRRIREESSAERRDALITTILNKLIDQTNF
ncbi:hypothetical protein M0R45_025416 [Rubus argutus]|uniref:Myb-like domain-containing protein n=1 Tax=Rubus argutus TaxID=59490 RepID=A0AAW1WW99_RUBAR